MTPASIRVVFAGEGGQSVCRSVIFAAARFALAALIAGGALSPVAAHESGDESVPAEPGRIVDVGLVGAYARVGGHGDRSSPFGDDVAAGRWFIEHASIGTSWRWSAQWGGTLSLGWDEADRRHTESAWLAWRVDASSSWSFGAGRTWVPMGSTVTRAGHIDRFRQMPLAKADAIDGHWVEDGVMATWRPAGGPGWPDRVDAALWRGRQFGDTRAPAYSLHAGWSWYGATFDAFVGHYPRAATDVLRSDAWHAAYEDGEAPPLEPDRRSRASVWGASVRWPMPGERLTLIVAMLGRHDACRTRCQAGHAVERDGGADRPGAAAGRSFGGWFEVQWLPWAGIEIAWRQEWVRSRAEPVGQVAGERRGQQIDGDRTSLMAGWRPMPSVMWAVEAGSQSMAGRRSTFVGLRVLLTPGSTL